MASRLVVRAVFVITLCACFASSCRPAGQVRQTKQPRPTVPQLGQPFEKWLPLLPDRPNDDYHLHFGRAGAQWIRSWILREDMQFCGVEVIEIIITRRGYDLKSDVLGVEVILADIYKTQRYEDFLKIARQLFNQDEPTLMRETPHKYGRASSFALQFGKKGEALFDGSTAYFWIWGYHGKSFSKHSRFKDKEKSSSNKKTE